MYPSFTARMRGMSATRGGATIAEGIAVKTSGELTYAVARPLVDDVLLVEERDLERAVALLRQRREDRGRGGRRRRARRAAGAPRAVPRQKVGLVLCGGNIDTRLLAAVLTRELVRERRIATFQHRRRRPAGPARRRQRP